ncbi:MAG: hypothetical protein Q9178_001452 [Gyalolechia marmorata]
MKLHTRTPLLSLTLFNLTILVSSQGTITLALATSDDETGASANIPFNTLFDASSTRKAVSIHVSSGTSIPISQDQIQCQCFSDKAGTQALGETFNNDFPGTELGVEPVQIGSIYCSDAEGMKKQMEGVSPAPPIPSATREAPSTAATAANNNNNNINAQPPPSSSPSASSTPQPPTAFLRFALSTDPSDDSSTQMPIPITNTAVPITDDKRIFSISAISASESTPSSNSLELLCQAFADAEATKPLAGGFRLEEERTLGGGELQVVGAVGCAMVGSGGFGGVGGLVGMS